MIADTLIETLLVLTVPLAFGLAALIIYNSHPQPPDDPVLDPDPETLCYCSGCGCRHRQLWMQWEGGRYRCIVCCGEGD